MDDLTAVEARTLLAGAFVEDPLMRWFFPDDDDAPARLRRALRAVRRAVPRRRPRRRRPSRPAGCRARCGGGPARPLRNSRRSLPTPPGLMTALMGAARAAEVGAAMGVISELRPPEPYAYLHLLGVDAGHPRPGAGGRGAGARSGGGCAAPDRPPAWRR